MIDHIYDGIHISSVHAIQQMYEVWGMGIRAVVRLDGRDRTAGQWISDFALLDMPFSDGAPVPYGYLQRATRFIHVQREAKRKILVHCQMGVSRASTIVMAYLIEYAGMNLGEAYQQVVSNRPIAQPHPALLGSLVNTYNLPFSIEAVYEPNFLKRLTQDVIPPYAEHG